MVRPNAGPKRRRSRAYFPAEDVKGASVSDDEVIFLVFSIGLAVVCAPFILGWLKHRLYLRGNAAAAVPLLGIAAAMGWITWVLQYQADPSVVGVYQFFYWIMGLAILLGPAIWALSLYGLRISVDVYQRRNMAVAIAIAAWIGATGLIFGGCNWGEADATGDGEGGWWIPLGFFAAGWCGLIIVTVIYLRGERHSLRKRLVQDRNRGDARAAASYVLSTAIVVTRAVAGDFQGWAAGMWGVGTVVGLMITHEFCRRAIPTVVETIDDPWASAQPSRWMESGLYFLISLGFWALSYWLEPNL